MKPSRVTLGTFLVMIIVIVARTVRVTDGLHRLPAPRQFVAIGAVWGILFLMIDVGFGKLAARLSVLFLLTGMVVGPFGNLLVQLLNTITERFAVPPEQDETGVPGTPGTPGVEPTRPRGRLA